MDTSTRSLLRLGALAGLALGAALFAVNLLAAAREHRAWIYWSGRGLLSGVVFLGGGVLLGLALAAVAATSLAWYRRRHGPPA